MDTHLQGRKVLVLTIAINGYDVLFADWLASQEQYARTHHYDYLAITQSPPFRTPPAVCSWLKIPLILRYLGAGYDSVFFVDADCRISADAPAIETVYQPSKSIYFALDGSKRINGGVIVTTQDPQSTRFFRRALLMADVPSSLLPPEDRCLYENSALIYLSKRLPGTAIIDQRWNNSSGSQMGEFIWHGRERDMRTPVSEALALDVRGLRMRRLKEGSYSFTLWRLMRFYRSVYKL